MEYRDGITVCADCGADLVEELIEIEPLVVIGTFSKEEDAEKLIEFLAYSNVENTVLDYIDSENEWTVSVEKQDEKNAKKLYSAFYQVEQEKEKSQTATKVAEAETDELDSDQEVSEDDQVTSQETAEVEDVLLEKTKALRTAASTTYVKKEDQYNDLRYTAIIFLGFGIIGLVFIILNIFTPLNFLNSALSLVVLSGMIIGFLIVGVTSLRKSFVVKNQIGEETDLTQSLNDWLIATVTESFLAEVQDDTLSDEVNFFNKMEKIKELVVQKFGQMDDSYLDQTIEDFYNEHFEQSEE
jgi:Integral membrane protein, interacts with FtsH